MSCFCPHYLKRAFLYFYPQLFNFDFQKSLAFGLITHPVPHNPQLRICVRIIVLQETILNPTIKLGCCLSIYQYVQVIFVRAKNHRLMVCYNGVITIATFCIYYDSPLYFFMVQLNTFPMKQNQLLVCSNWGCPHSYVICILSLSTLFCYVQVIIDCTQNIIVYLYVPMGLSAQLHFYRLPSSTLFFSWFPYILRKTYNIILVCPNGLSLSVCSIQAIRLYVSISWLAFN